MIDYQEAQAYEFIKNLTQWKRFIGSEGENEAKQYIFNQFSELGIECQRETFTCSNFLPKYFLRIMVSVLGVLLAFIGYFYSQVLMIHALILSIIIIACLPFINLIMAGTDFGSSLGEKFESENIIGHVQARNQPPKRKVFIMSHYDTKSQTFPILVRIVLYTLGALGGIITVVLVFLSSLIYLLNSTLLIPTSIPFYLAIIFCVCLLLLNFNLTGNNSVGATDNGAAVGVQIGIIRNLLEFPPENTDVYFLATSAEEIGLFGAISFIKKHIAELDKETTYFLNYEMIGGYGKLNLLTKFGIPPKSASKEIIEILLEIAKEKNLDVGTQYLPTGAMADDLPIQKRGFKTLLIESGDGSVTRKIHTPKDNMELVTKESLRNAIILGFEFVQKIDKKP
ncbi:MAG: M28 family metallopeptidase [Candidatus Helarchaeota archaeon]